MARRAPRGLRRPSGGVGTGQRRGGAALDLGTAQFGNAVRERRVLSRKRRVRGRRWRGPFRPDAKLRHRLPALHYLNGNAANLPGRLTATLMAAAAIALSAAGGIRPSFRPGEVPDGSAASFDG